MKNYKQGQTGENQDGLASQLTRNFLLRMQLSQFSGESNNANNNNDLTKKNGILTQSLPCMNPWQVRNYNRDLPWLNCGYIFSQIENWG